MGSTSRKAVEEKLLAAICRRPDMSLSQLELIHFRDNELSNTNRHRAIFQTISKLFRNGIQPGENDLIELLSPTSQSARGKAQLSRTIIAFFDLLRWSDLGPDAEQVRGLAEQLRDLSLRQTAKRELHSLLEETDGEMPPPYRERLVKGLENLKNLLQDQKRRTLDVQVDEMKLQSIRAVRNKQGVVGLHTGFPLLSHHLNGIQNELYFFGGSAGMGKSTFLSQIAWQLITQNSDTVVLFFSLDQKALDIAAKLVSLAGEIPVSYVKNPSLTSIPDEKKRRQGIEMVSHMRDWLEIIDETNGAVSLEDLMETVGRVRLEHSGPLVVLVDPLSKLEAGIPGLTGQEKLITLVTRLKTLTASHRMAVIAAVELMAEAEGRRPARYDLPPCPAFLQHSYATMLLYCDHINNYETPFIEWEWETEDLMVPIAEIDIVKNKMGEYRGRLFYRFYNSLARYKECVEVENENYSAMIENIDNFNISDATTASTKAIPKNINIST